MSEEMKQAINQILEVYNRVATGETNGAGGSFYADGQSTLNHVSIPVEMLERLAVLSGQPVHGRGANYRN